MRVTASRCPGSTSTVPTSQSPWYGASDTSPPGAQVRPPSVEITAWLR